LPDSKTAKKAIVLNAPAMQVLADLPPLGVFVIVEQSAGTKLHLRISIVHGWPLPTALH
jgi:hypothetical protein